MPLSKAFAIGVLILGCIPALAGKDFATFDTDKDRVLTDAEAQAGGRGLFQQLDANHSQSLDAGELGGRLGGPVQKAADVNADGVLSAEEYAGLLQARFKSANADGNGAVDERELNSLAGALLLVMMGP